MLLFGRIVVGTQKTKRFQVFFSVGRSNREEMQRDKFLGFFLQYLDAKLLSHVYGSPRPSPEMTAKRGLQML